MNGKTVALGGVAALGAALAGTLNWWSGAAPPQTATPSAVSGALLSTAAAPLPNSAAPPRVAYQAAAKRSPFKPAAQGKQSAAHPASPAVAPDPNRPKQPLEAFDLSALTLVGIVSYRGRRYALVRDSAAQLHRLSVGDHLGMRQGRVRRIGDAWLELVEIVPNERGGWAERKVVVGVPTEASQT